MRTRKIIPAILSVILCSCAATSLKQTWKSPAWSGTPLKKSAVLTVDDRTLLRQGFENRFVLQLRNGGAEAFTTYGLLTLEEIKQDKKAAAEKFLAEGADSVIILRLVDTQTYYREYRPGDERYAGIVTGWVDQPWYDYCTLAFMDMSPTYSSMKVSVYLETVVFDLRSGKRVWSCLTDTVIKETTDRVAEMDPLVARILQAMRKDGVIR